MAMKKAELKEHQEKYAGLIAKARKAEEEGLYRKAVELSLSSWEYVDGMMQFERRFNKNEFDSIKTIDMVLRYAPLLLDYPSLTKLETMLRQCRRIEKNTSVKLTDKLAEAKDVMWKTHRLWDHLERNPNSIQDTLHRAIGWQKRELASVVDLWEKMGLIRRIPENGTFRLTLSTRMDEMVPAKCPSCGNVANAPKAMFFEEAHCPECEGKVMFVILAHGTSN